VIRQPNAGTAAAVNVAREAARGEVLALLDSDDRWPADKLARQLDALGDAGLLYGDMTVIDGDGALVRESWLSLVWDGTPSGEGCFGALLSANAATQSSILLRADLSRRLGPIPPHLRAADWWLALSAARAGRIAYLAEPRTFYRIHDANLGLGTEGKALARAHVRRAATQRVFLRDIRAGEVTPLELAHAWNAFERNVAEALRQFGNPFATIVSVTDEDRAAARREPLDDMVSAVRALAADPWNQDAHHALQEAWGREQ
jgi:glycosyltransferase involved in cell wall biosynthesis